MSLRPGQVIRRESKERIQTVHQGDEGIVVHRTQPMLRVKEICLDLQRKDILPINRHREIEETRVQEKGNIHQTLHHPEGKEEVPLTYRHQEKFEILRPGKGNIHQMPPRQEENRTQLNRQCLEKIEIPLLGKEEILQAFLLQEEIKIDKVHHIHRRTEEEKVQTIHRRALTK